VILGLPEATRGSPWARYLPSVLVSCRAAVAAEQAVRSEPADVRNHEANEQFAADLVDFNDALL
jgi:hypothetical protein